jgi:hypothetical protein
MPGQDRSPLSSLFGQRAIDRRHALLLLPARHHALPEHAHREQAATGRRDHSDQPGCDTEEYATVHKPRFKRKMLSTCQGRLKQFIYEKFI